MLSTIARTASRIARVSAVRSATSKVSSFRPLIRGLHQSLASLQQYQSPKVPHRRADEIVDEDEEAEEEDFNAIASWDEQELHPEEPEVAKIGYPAPHWATNALDAGQLKILSSDHFKGKWLVLFFYPLDFTFVCPTEIRAFSDRIEEFRKLDTNVVACSVDSEYSHLAWTKQDPAQGGLGPMNIPILSDITKTISRRYGVLIEDQGVALRGLFIIDPQGILRQITVNDLPIGRSVDETLRLLQAFQFHAKHGEVCPANWKPGQDGMTTDEEGLKRFFGKKN